MTRSATCGQAGLPGREPPNDVGPGCLLKFMGLAAFLAFMVYSIGHTDKQSKALEQPSPEPPSVEANTSPPTNPDHTAEPIRLWTDVTAEVPS